MKKIGHYSLFVVLTLIITMAVFSAGFYIGNTNGSFRYNYEAAAGEPVDMGPFWRTWHLLEEKYVSSDDPVSPEDRLWGAISGLVDSYDDPYTVFLPPVLNEEFNESIGGNFEGVGMELSVKDGFLTVVSPLKDTPAWNAGIKAGDVILKIDDLNAVGLSIEESVDLIRGPRDTQVVVTVGREGVDEPIVIPITRGIIEIPIIDTELRSDGIFVISLYNFNANSSRLFRGALREFLVSGSDKLIFDLRGNPGGFLDASIDIASWFLPTGKVVVRESFGDGREEKVFRSKGYKIFDDDVEIAVLIDKGSASASEIVAGAIGEHGIGTLVGETTFGKGSVQELIDVTKETSLKVTIARWLTPDGTSISEGGLDPHIFVDQIDDDIDNEIDTQLEAAAQILLGTYVPPVEKEE